MALINVHLLCKPYMLPLSLVFDQRALHLLNTVLRLCTTTTVDSRWSPTGRRPYPFIFANFVPLAVSGIMDEVDRERRQAKWTRGVNDSVACSEGMSESGRMDAAAAGRPADRREARAKGEDYLRSTGDIRRLAVLSWLQANHLSGQGESARLSYYPQFTFIVPVPSKLLRKGPITGSTL